MTPLPSAIDGMFCDPEILKAIQDLGAQEVDRRVTLASDSRTGFTLMNGNGVMSMAGVSGSTGSTGSTGGSSTSNAASASGGSFFSMSCLDKILNSGVSGLSNIFNPPSWTAIQAMLMRAATNFVCAEANKLFAQVTQPLNQALYRNASLSGFSPALASIAGQVGLPTSFSLGGSIGIQQGQAGPLVPLDQRFTLNGQNVNDYNGSAASMSPQTTKLPSRLLGQ